ncbi:MAG TPA: S1/P1 nuclease [Candidatus Binatia bacterium]
MNRLFLRRWIISFVAIGSFFPTHSLFAWGDLGHQIVGVIAYSRLKPSTKTKVDALLAADNDDLTAPDFVSRTTWADKYRESDRQTTRIRYEATRNWHFADIDIATGDIDAACEHHPSLSRGTFASAGPANSCVIDKIDQFIVELRNPFVIKAEKILALKFLLHFIADVHQPLHSANNKDRGGNDIPVLIADDKPPTNLHFYWDNFIVEKLGSDPRSIGARLSRNISTGTAEAWSKGTPIIWGKESFRRAKSVAYHFAGLQEFVGDRGLKGVRLDAVYENSARLAARQQLAKSGIRLAVVLNNTIR